MVEKFRAGFDTAFAQKFVEYVAPKIKLRTSDPYGYTIEVNRQDSLTEEAKIFANVLNFHHSIYTDFAEDEITEIDERRRSQIGSNELVRQSNAHRPSIRSSLVPQPSYRTYIYYRDHSLCATISPEFMTPVGAIEAAGMEVSRSPKHGASYTEDEMRSFMEELRLKIENTLIESDVQSGG